MPRVRIENTEAPARVHGALRKRLVEELKSNRESGQPFIYEEAFPSKKIRLLVLWDELEGLSPEQRTDTILAALEESDGKDYCEKLTLVSGLTIPEAFAAGMLPYEILTAHRKSDPVTLDQCRDAALAEGASKLFGSGVVRLLFPTDAAAEACRKRLSKRLPGSEPIWLVQDHIWNMVVGEGDADSDE